MRSKAASIFKHNRAMTYGAKRENLPRKVSISRIDEILIQVSDVEQSLKFYRDGLGIPFKATSYGDGSFEAEVGQTSILLHPDFDDSIKGRKRGAGILIHFWVPDADIYSETIRSHGIVLHETPEDRPWGRHFAVVDPDGYRLEFLAPLKKKVKA